MERESFWSRRQEEQDLAVIPGLPDDVALQCLARVPRLYHNTLRCVCKVWRNHLSSHAYVNIRRALGLSESWIYVMSRDGDECLHWHAFDTMNKKWVQLPPMPVKCLKRYGMCCEAIGTQIFVLGGCRLSESPSSEAFVFNILTNQWTQMAHMVKPRCHFAVAVHGGSLYAIGGLGSSSEDETTWEMESPSEDEISWEVYSLKTNNWSLYEDPNILPDLGESLVFNGQILVRQVGQNAASSVYKLDEGLWTTVDDDMIKQWSGPAVNVDTDVYMLDQTYGIKLTMLDHETNTWRHVGRLSPLAIRSPCRMASVGKKLYIFGRGLKTLILDLERIGQNIGLLVTTSVDRFIRVGEMVLFSKVVDM